MDCSPPGFSVCGIVQARTLEWVATPSSRDGTRVSYVFCTGRQVLYHWSHLEACAYMHMNTFKQTLDGDTHLQTAAWGMGRGRDPLHLCSGVYFNPAVVFVFPFI